MPLLNLACTTIEISGIQILTVILFFRLCPQIGVHMSATMNPSTTLTTSTSITTTPTTTTTKKKAPRVQSVLKLVTSNRKRKCQLSLLLPARRLITAAARLEREDRTEKFERIHPYTALFFEGNTGQGKLTIFGDH